MLGVVNASEVPLSGGREQAADKQPDERPVSRESQQLFSYVLIDHLKRGRYQPREEFNQEALEELSESIRQQGVIQPLVVRRVGGDRYEIIAGERRWRAAKLAGFSEIPAIIREASDLDAMAIALIENLQRESLNPIEEAVALQRLTKEFGLTQQQTAQVIGRSRSAVTNQLRLLNLNAEVGMMVQRRELDMGHARTLLGLDGKEQIDAAKEVVFKGMSVRETEKLVRKCQLPPKEPSRPRELPSDLKALEEAFAALLGANVSIKEGAGGKGKVVIQYSSHDELRNIYRITETYQRS